MTRSTTAATTAASVLTLLLLMHVPAEAKTTIADLVAKPECPVAVAHYRGGQGDEDHFGVIVAVWRDATIVRAARGDKAWEKHVVGHVGAKDLQTLAALLARGDIWSVAH